MEISSSRYGGMTGFDEAGLSLPLCKVNKYHCYLFPAVNPLLQFKIRVIFLCKGFVFSHGVGLAGSHEGMGHDDVGKPLSGLRAIAWRV